MNWVHLRGKCGWHKKGGCTNLAVAGGKCRKHGKGNGSRVIRLCNVEGGCMNQVHLGGKCIRHKASMILCNEEEIKHIRSNRSSIICNCE